MEMTSAEILAAIAASTTLQALALSRNDGEIARLLSVNKKKVVPSIITSRGIASKYPGGAIAAEIVLMKLEGARDAMIASPVAEQKVLGSLLRRQLAFLASEGLDFGDATLRGMLDSFATPQGGNILTSQEVANLKSMAVVDDFVSVEAVTKALNGE